MACGNHAFHWLYEPRQRRRKRVTTESPRRERVFWRSGDLGRAVCRGRGKPGKDLLPGARPDSAQRRGCLRSNHRGRPTVPGRPRARLVRHTHSEHSGRAGGRDRPIGHGCHCSHGKRLPLAVAREVPLQCARGAPAPALNRSSSPSPSRVSSRSTEIPVGTRRSRNRSRCCRPSGPVIVIGSGGAGSSGKPVISERWRSAQGSQKVPRAVSECVAGEAPQSSQ